jgi:phospholipid/cholesterol/gamma-HCH transport system permease protein
MTRVQALVFDMPFHVERATDAEGGVVVRLEGQFAFVDGAIFWKEIRACLEPTKPEELQFDLSGVESMDGGIMALLIQTKWELAASGSKCEIVGATGAVQKILKLYQGDTNEDAKDSKAKEKPLGLLEQIGNTTVAMALEAQLGLAFLGNLVLSLGGILRRPSTANWREVPSIMNRSGADAVPIVVLINFLMGFVMGFQSAVQLKQFGANIFVADLVGLSITRELGPLMTAIIVCGRSGAAFAAELGTMKVSEEVDALRTMGFGTLRFLVFPRVLALFLVMPVLTLIGDFVGLFGGLVVGIVSLDLTVTGYLNETQRALAVWDVFQGLIKCGVFALAIGFVACQQGLATSGGAEGVGRRTTSSVVAALFTLILIDAAFTMVFHALGL